MWRAQVTKWTAVGVGLFALLPTAAHALTISPTVIEFDVRPGETVTRTVRVYNEARGPVEVTSEIGSIIANNTNSETTAVAGTNDPSLLTSWIALPAPFTLTATQALDVSIVTNVPIGVAPGSRVAAVLFTSHEKTNAGSIGIISKIGPVAIVTVTGGGVAHAELQNFQTVDRGRVWGNVFDAIPPFTTGVLSTGAVTVVPHGAIDTSWFGRAAVMHETVNADARRLLPGWHRSFESGGAGVGLLGFGREWRRFGFGRYHTTLSLNLGDHVATRTLTFWVVPWRSGALVVTILIFTLILVKQRRANRTELV